MKRHTFSVLLASSTIVLLALFHPGMAASTVKVTFHVESPDTPVNLIELFSSEGCSSCPPADAWLAALRGNPQLWRQFVPLEFHVDYWNNLGWQDRLSQSMFTRRQNEYASAWGSNQVYTPEFVLNGREWKAGYLGGRDLPKAGTARVGVLSVSMSAPHRFEVVFRPQEKSAEFVVSGVLLGNGLVSQVTAGENRGERLRHEFAVLQLKSEPMKKVGNGFSTELELTSPANVKAGSYSIAVWVTKAGSTQPIQATGGDLP
jgi:hypothetical protein